jgi:hypothetical protein
MRRIIKEKKASDQYEEKHKKTIKDLIAEKEGEL